MNFIPRALAKKKPTVSKNRARCARVPVLAVGKASPLVDTAESQPKDTARSNTGEERDFKADNDGRWIETARNASSGPIGHRTSESVDGNDVITTDQCRTGESCQQAYVAKSVAGSDIPKTSLQSSSVILSAISSSASQALSNQARDISPPPPATCSQGDGQGSEERTAETAHDEGLEDKLKRLQQLSNRITSHISLHIPSEKHNQESPGSPVCAVVNDSYKELQNLPARDDDDEDDDGDGGKCSRDDSSDEDALPVIVSLSKNQRWPVDDEEPVCVVCGKYGEYICDQTEADVCSLECKAKNLVRRGLPSKTLANVKHTQIQNTSSEGSEEATFDASNVVMKPYIFREHRDVASLTAQQVQDIRNEVQIFVEGMDVQRPILEFKQLSLPEKVQGNLETSGYLTPTPIQMQALPAALARRDLTVCAQTSSGKTASFLIPAVMTIFNQVLQSSRDDHTTQTPFVLILAPTRELAMQIEEQAKQLMKGLASMKTALLVGGLPLPPQLHRLRQGVQLLVGTPGRILEIIKEEAVALSEIRLVVIDEVDTMLQLGFQEQVYDVMVHLPDNHQTILTSATIPPSIEKLALSLLNNPIFISVGTPSTPCASVKQIILWVEEPSKKKKLFAILQDSRHFRPPIIVFVDSKMGADLLAQAVEKSCDLRTASLHGDKPQSQRSQVLQGFREGAYDVLVSTGVLGRGIDIPGIKLVINFDMPGSVEEYIHQIGRTGRLGTAGTAMTFINNNNKKLFLQFTHALKPLGVVLPPELVQSPHLSYQRQQHRTSSSSSSPHRGYGHEHQKGGRQSHHDGRDRAAESSHGSGGGWFHDRKRSNDRSTVNDILKKRKKKFKP